MFAQTRSLNLWQLDTFCKTNCILLLKFWNTFLFCVTCARPYTFRVGFAYGCYHSRFTFLAEILKDAWFLYVAILVSSIQKFLICTGWKSIRIFKFRMFWWCQTILWTKNVFNFIKINTFWEPAAFLVVLVIVTQSSQVSNPFLRVRLETNMSSTKNISPRAIYSSRAKWEWMHLWAHFSQERILQPACHLEQNLFSKIKPIETKRTNAQNKFLLRRNFNS